MLDAKLVIVGGADLAAEYLLTLPTTIGRSKENGIPLTHPLVSRRHCELFVEGDRLCVRDLGSLNGTFIGNQPVEGVAHIEPGQLLTIGTVTFRAVYNGFQLDADEDADVLGEGQWLRASVCDRFGQEARPGRTMTRPTTRPGVKAADAEITESGLDTDRIARSSQDTDRLPTKKVRPPHRRRSK
jgi:predicted component of type VI protein secretion system